MGPLLKFLIAAERLARQGVKRDAIVRFAKQQFGEVTELLQKQIDRIYTRIKKPKVGKETKKEGEVIPFRDKNNLTKDDPMGDLEKILKGEGNVGLPKKEGIMSTDEASTALQKAREDTERLKEDPKLQEILRSIGVEDTAPLDSAANVRTALKNMENRMRVGENEANIRATLREFLSRRLKEGTLNIPDARERDAIEKVYQGGVDPIEVFRKAYGEDALIAVDDVFEQFNDRIMRDSDSYKEIGDKFEKLFKLNRGFYDMSDLPVPKKEYGYDPGLISNKELTDKLRKDLREKEMLEDFDPTDRTKNATGGRVLAAGGGLAGILKV